MIPVGDSNRAHRTPWVTRLIILLNIGAFLYLLALPASAPADRREATADFVEQTEGVCYGYETLPSDADRFICTWSFQPREFFDAIAGESGLAGDELWAALASIVTAMFLHGGWLHILGNMLYLWVFGDNVEDRLGHGVFLLFYLLGGVAGSFIQGAMDPNSLIPVLGASGAVASVLGAYLIWYPGATIRVVIPFFILIFIPLPVPAWMMIGLWFAQNLLAGYATIAETATDQGVAWFAHIGGFVFGMLVAVLAGSKARKQRRAPEW